MKKCYFPFVGLVLFALTSCFSESRIVMQDSASEYVVFYESVYGIELVNEPFHTSWRTHPMVVGSDGRIEKGKSWDEISFINGRGVYYSLREERYGLMDTTGRLVTAPVFNDVKLDEEFATKGLFPVQINDAWGVIDTNGRFLLSCAFNDETAVSYCQEFSPGYYGECVIVECDDGRMGISERNGKAMARPMGWHLDNDGMDRYGLVEAYRWSEKDGEDEMVYINKRGKKIVPPKEGDEISRFSRNLSLLKRGSKYGFINNDGKVVVEPKYDGVDGGYRWQQIYKNLIKVREGDKYGLVDDSLGREVVAPRFEYIDLEDERAVLVRLGAEEGSAPLHGCLNERGVEVIEPVYSSLRFTFMSDDRLEARRGDRMGVIDSRGGVIVDFVYDSVSESQDVEGWSDGLPYVSRYRGFFNAWRGDTVFYIGADGKEFPASDTVLYAWDSAGRSNSEDVAVLRPSMPYVPALSRYTWVEHSKNWINVSFSNIVDGVNGMIMLKYGHYNESGFMNLDLGVGYRVSNDLGKGWVFSAGYNIWRFLSAGCMVYKGENLDTSQSGYVAAPYVEVRPLWWIWSNVKNWICLTIKGAYDIPLGSFGTAYGGGFRLGFGVSYVL